MSEALAPTTPLTYLGLAFCFVLTLAFEFSNGFHDTANAVATVVYTHSLRPVQAVILPGAWNFLGVMLGGVAVAFALVELLPPDLLTPPNGNPAVAMLLTVFLAALIWNVSTWWFGLPSSISHAIIGALLGIALVNAGFTRPGEGIDWSQVWGVLRALLVSPLLGFVLAGALFRLVGWLVRDRALFEPTTESRPSAWWVRTLLILTCSGVSFAHGSNDGQKSIGLIMLTVIGLAPAACALNPVATDPPRLAQAAADARPLIERWGDGENALAVADAARLAVALGDRESLAALSAVERSATRDAIYHVTAELKVAVANRTAPPADREAAQRLRDVLRAPVEYVPAWVRLLSAVFLGAGTMIGYRRIVVTIGERIGRRHLTPAQGASAEIVGAAGYSGLPVSTTHIITSGVAGTMVGSGAGVQSQAVWQIALAWLLTLPVTVGLSAGLFWLFARW
ncbi:MAG: inorganic phosphate transporter [Acetobacteraceae bacterium]